ncbi:MAG: hypothetical protein CML49_03535, partial [Rhodobacteraceae bacterium]
ISIDTDGQWQSLCKVIGHPEWADDRSYATYKDRHQRHDFIDNAITAWTRERDKYEAMEILQSAGITSGAVQNSGDLLRDEQYQYRQFHRFFDHLKTGPFHHHAN